MPNSRRPWLSTSSMAYCSACTMGWWSGSSATPVPILIRLVRVAAAAPITAGFPKE